MYSESDLEGAVAAGILTPQAANAFRDHIAAMRATPAVDEESFRLLTGFNDIFVAIAITGSCEFTPMLVGNTLPSARNNPGSSHDSPLVRTTPSFSFTPIRALPSG